ncbi:MAG: GrpB family protein [Halanaerobium sp.]|nr:GrpB family protein [Halanaerobium sp.]
MPEKTRVIEVVPYNPNWKHEFNRVKDMLLDYVGDFAQGIEHVGSTSVEGLAAKPILDIDIVIEDYELLPAIIDRLAEAGYEHEGNLGIEGREAFRRTRKDELMKHHLYVCPRDGKGYREHIAFRDYLRKDEKARREYQELKMKLAERYRNDIDSYSKAKTDFITRILDRTLYK